MLYICSIIIKTKEIMKVLHNTFLFEVVRYFDDKAVISITPTQSAGEVEYITEKVAYLTTNLGGGFEEWVKDQY